MPIMNDTNFPEITDPTGEEVLYVSGKQTIKVKTIQKYGGSYATATDPAINAAVSTVIVDAYSGVIITTTGAGNAQTIQDPTDTTAGKRFTVVNHAASTDNIDVNGITLEPQEAQSYIWDGANWVPVAAVDAEDMTFTPAGNLSSTNVQAAIEEVDTEKADKVSGGTENNFAALDSSGNIKDSGHKHSDYESAGAAASAVSGHESSYDHSLLHTQNTDTGTISTSFKINSSGSEADLKTTNLTGDRDFEFPDIDGTIVTSTLTCANGFEIIAYS